VRENGSMARACFERANAGAAKRRSLGGQGRIGIRKVTLPGHGKAPQFA